MSQLAATLREAADKNHELLAELRQTDYAPSSLKQNSAFIDDLNAQISSTDKELKKLHQVTEDERQDHVRYRDSNFKRYLHKMGGSKGKDKFTSKAEKEEREFLEAWQKERSAKESRHELSRALEHARSNKVNLEQDVKRHERAQSELDQLYDSIFSGPTPDVAGEDHLEQAVQQNRDSYDQANRSLSSEKYVLEILGRADQSLSAAGNHMDDAYRRSQRDTYLGGGTFTDMMERDALAKAQNAIHATIRHMAEAQRHERIKDSDAQVKAAYQDLKGRIEEQKGRCQGAEQNLQQAGNGLEQARKELQRVRAEAFERFAGGGGQRVASAPPPQYTS
ncbi:hypothetical protein CERZMDRAFT_52005 [Cercospora zeae-maydis SCOH1-5]|uniref:Uncharacterized protein n=1 Tax=Cercospora zeae-maydis SCOH1-5 TaxID=717836 RepID=A0A6A6F370_9PEZI|nr:hypothetical protein CERZMDRAFT_52005 [Cercospora zeae-maydis SCOH1-5]